jgi:hypothetical protein
MLPDASVDPLDPERPKIALALLASGVSVDSALPDLLLSPLVRALLRPPIALGLLENLSALLPGV